MDRKDWTLLVIAARGGRPLQPVQLQKALFLIGKTLMPSQLKVDDFYCFVAYDYGPFCKDIYMDAEALVEKGLLHIDRSPQFSYRLYSATEAGVCVAKALRKMLPAEVWTYLHKVVDTVVSMPFNDLVRTIYRLYPDMRANSVFQE